MNMRNLNNNKKEDRSTMPILEVCAASIASARAAAEGGAQRIELCTRLDLDGLTPTEDEIREARLLNGLRLHVLIRPREGDFVYSSDEFALMKEQIEMSRRLGADGVVIGALTPVGDIDVEHCLPLMAAAQGMQVTFHRAFDQCRDPRQGLQDIMRLGCHRLLTSGQAPTAETGIPLLRELNLQSQGRIIIMPGAGVNPGNARHILMETGCTEIHSSSRMPGEKESSPEVVRNILNAIQ